MTLLKNGASVAVVSLLCIVVSCQTADVHLYVSPTGSDQHNGTSPGSPVKTMFQALTLTKRLPLGRDDIVYVELMEGYHDLDETLHVQYNNIVIRAYNNQTVHVTGGRRIPSSSFSRVTNTSVLMSLPAFARNHVRMVHLPDLGITDYGQNSRHGFYRDRVAPLEVFYNGQPLHIARWPNQGFINIVEVPDGTDGRTLRYNSTVPSTWRQVSEPWVYGYWYWSWADRAIKVANLDTSTSTVTLEGPALYGLRTGHYNEPDADWTKQGGYFRFENILSALDEPGEYYMDRQTGNLYVWMPSNDGDVTQNDVIYVSMIDTCIEISGRVSNVELHEFTLEACRAYGVHGNNLPNLRLINMEIRNTGSVAAACYGDCRNVEVSGCSIHDVDGGVTLRGGNRSTLESSGHVVEDNVFYRFSRVAAVGTNAISADGVGHQLRHNLMYDGQYTAIRYQGNDIVMEWNHIYDVCRNASDCGALHTGRDWTQRGNVIRHNLIHDTLRLVPGASCRAVMLDDQASSTTITQNVFAHNHVHVDIGGGRDNIVTNNVLYDATFASVEFDARGTTHAFDNDLLPRLHAMPYTSSLWTMRYPDLASIDSKNKSLPEGNVFFKNLVYNEANIPTVHSSGIAANNDRMLNITLTGYSLGPTDHVAVSIKDFRIKCNAADWANEVGFIQVPSRTEVGPRGYVGPSHLKQRIPTPLPITSGSACTTHAPATLSPVPAYIPDGSRDNDLFNVTKEGCWLAVAKCSNHPNAVGTYRDKYGETHNNAGHNETMCFRRAASQWKYCGSHDNEQVVAIYGPTGATRLSGDGCFMAEWGCPKHGGPADGHVLTQGRFFRDSYAETSSGAAHDEEACLSRAHVQWVWCGSSPNHPITSIYAPNGSLRTAGAGCWIHIDHCSNHPHTKSMFYDAWGATNLQTDTREDACLSQAEYYWKRCGSDTAHPATAFYRPTTATRTFG